ncbi:MAG: hypothetical protein LBH47_01415, partial [Christensenellaceae bacterium]|nr:hypothetical protein [Christensenellaceae bacterium]
PARYPNLLTNGVSGIAVGLATNIPPHNLGELIDAHIAWIDNNRITLKEILKIIKGPDFPTGGYILNNDELVNAYATGKGKCQMSAKIHIEVEGDKRSIVIDEVPYQVNKVQLQRNIADMRETKKGLETIQAITDESDRNGTRVIIRLKKDGDARSVVKLLYKYTQLQCNFNFNMVAIANGKPRQMTLMQIIEYYCLYQRDIIYKRSVFELRKAKERAHIIEGLLIAIKNIDEVIKIIKTSKHTTEARERLQKTFNLSERQAQAILDLRLARLTSLEVFKLKEELDELLALIEKLSKVIASKRLQFDIVKEEMLDIKKRFKSLIGRRTTVLRPEEEIPVPSSDDTPPTENIKISISEDGRLKKGAGKGAVMTIKTETDKLLYVFTHNGMVHKMMGYELPDVTKFDGEKIISVLPTEPDKSPEVEVVWLSKTGMIKRSAFADAFNVQKDTYQCCKLREDKPDEIINVQILNKDDTILMVTNSGNVLNARTNDIPLQGRIAAGVKGIKLEEDEFLFYHSVVNSQDIITVKTTNNREIKVNVKDIPKMKRYGKGQLLIKNLKKNEMITMIMDKG